MVKCFPSSIPRGSGLKASLILRSFLYQRCFAQIYYWFNYWGQGKQQGLKISWTTGFKVQWPAAQIPAGGQSLVLCPRWQHWGQINIATNDRDDGTVCTLGNFSQTYLGEVTGVTEVPFRETSKGWGNGQAGMFCSPKGNAKPCTWEGITPCSSTGWRLAVLKEALQRKAWRSWWSGSWPWASDASL